MNLIVLVIIVSFTITANAWEVPCRLGKEILRCEDYCNKWKKYPPKANLAICVRGCKAAYDGMKIGYQRSFPSLDIKEPHCRTWWKKLHGLPVTPYTREATGDGCTQVEVA